MWPDGWAWVAAAIISVGMAVVVGVVQLATPVPPGGDPGNWLATSYGYFGHPYPSQITPLGYPPALFPLLGFLVLVGGGPLAAARLAVVVLCAGTGLSIYALAQAMLRSRLLALASTTALLLDPALLSMYFWGAYPNLLGGIFLNMALVGLIVASRRRPGVGALIFWVFAALTILSHTLVGVALVTTTGVFFLLSLPFQFPRKSNASAPPPTDSPATGIRALWFTRAGLVGAAIFTALVGGYYLGTRLAGIGHPYYFASGSTPVHAPSFSLILRPILPGLVINGTVALYLLVAFGLIALLVYGTLLATRPRWLTTSALVLLSLWLGIEAMGIGGWVLNVVTDYHRFGFLLVLPLALSAAYFLDRTWLAPPAKAGPPDAAPADPRLPPAAVLARRRRRRPAIFAVVSVLLLLLVADLVTAPALARDDRVFTRVGHDQSFLNAVAALQSSGVPGGVITIAGADKWIRALTARDAYAPRSSTAYLFYPTQVTDSELALYSLSSRYAITNGLASASLRSLNTTFLDGVPTYGAFHFGSLVQICRIDPTSLVVHLQDPATNASLDVPLAGLTPSLIAPATTGAPLVIVYDELQFALSVTVTIPPTAPVMYANLTVVAHAPYRLQSLDGAVAGYSSTSAVASAIAPAGSFLWKPVGPGTGGLATTGTVSPATALDGVTNFDPKTQGPAVLFTFNASANSTTLNGSIALTTPQASQRFPGLPWFLSTTSTWSSLQVAFIVLRNITTVQVGRLSFHDEIGYLQAEYGCRTIFNDGTWADLQVPGT